MANSMTAALREALQPQVETKPEPETKPAELEEKAVAVEPETAEPEPVEEGEDDGEGEGIEYINDLPEALGWDAEDLYSLKLKLDGDKAPVTVGEIKDRLQSVEVERKKLAEEREQWEVERKRQATPPPAPPAAQDPAALQAQREVMTIESAAQALEQNWASREDTEPGKVAIERQKVSQRYAAAKAKLGQVQQQTQQQQAQQYGAWLQDQERQLLKSIPEWSDKDKRATIQREISDFAKEKYGATDDDLRRVNARTIMMIRDAMHGEEIREKAGAVTERLKKAPKRVARGVQVKRSAAARKRAAELVTKARETRRKGDITAAIRGTILSSQKRK